MLRPLVLCLLLLHTATAWALKPDRHWAATPDSLHLTYQASTLTTPDQAQLATWVVEPIAPAADQHTTLVLAYGDAGNMGNWVHQAQALARAGYWVYLFDYRGFGHSSDFAINYDHLYYDEFATDLNTVLADARRRYPRQRLGVLGFSMGTIMGSEAAAAHRCDFLITEGYVGSPQRIKDIVWKAKQKVLVLPAGAAAYAQVAPRVRCPWLLVAGTQDQNTPPEDSAAIVAAGTSKQRRQLVKFDGSHLEGFAKLSAKEFGDQYVAAIQRFLAPAAKG